MIGYKKTLGCFWILIVVSWSAAAQTPTKVEGLGAPLGDSKWHIDYFLVQPSGFLFFDLGTDVEADEEGNFSKPDFYKDGAAAFSLQVLGGDLFYGRSRVRGGLTGGLGISVDSKGESDLGSYLITYLGLGLTFNQNIRFEIGYNLGLSAVENYDDIFDDAIYVGFTFPTSFGKKLKKAIAAE